MHCTAGPCLSFSLFSLFLLFTFMVSEEKRKEEHKGDFNLILLFAKNHCNFLVAKPNQSYFVVAFVASYRENYTVCCVIP